LDAGSFGKFGYKLTLPGKQNDDREQKETARLKKELRDTQSERNILKKGASIFSGNDGKYSNS
jgi:hypothetical protein